MEKVKEVRQFKIEVRAEASGATDSRTIAGTAIVFNSESQDLGGFVEIVDPMAFTQQDVQRFDIRLIYQHNDQFIPLARSNKGRGTLRIAVDATGVHFEFDAKKTSSGEEILQAVRSGDLDAMSFAFYLGDGQKWVKRNDGSYLRTITRFEDVAEFSIVNTPAYLATVVNARSLEEAREAEERDNKDLDKAKADADALAEAKRKEEEDKKYWGKYEDILAKYKNLN